MPLRPQQKALEDLKNEIQNGNNRIKEIFLAWGVGSGKSLSPVILSDLLINGRLQVVIVPRNTLKSQGETSYSNDFYYTDKKARIAANIGDPHRGCESCFTSYQAIASNPEFWIDVFTKNECMLVLDEFHHLADNGGVWGEVIKKLKELSFLTVLLSGSIARGDRGKIPFVPYDEKGDIDFTNTESRKFIIYTTKQALKDGVVTPFKAITVNGSGSYIDLDGITRHFHKFTGNSNELRCSFMSDYANSMIDLSFSHWMKYKKEHFWSKILIVSPDIKTAKEYVEKVSRKFPFIKSAIATSEDSKESEDNIKRFKKDNGEYNSLDCLVSVNICYEGLDVQPVSHILALHIIRSLPWNQQMIGRATRVYKNKQCGYIFCPEDPKMVECLKKIDGGIVESVDLEDIEPKPEPKKPDPDQPEGIKHTIEALSSKAHLENLGFPEFTPPPIKKETQSEIEARLRKEVNAKVNSIVGATGNGNKHVKSRIFWMKVKLLVNKGRDDKGKLIRKKIDEMSVKELQKIADFCKNYS